MSEFYPSYARPTALTDSRLAGLHDRDLSYYEGRSVTLALGY